VTVRPILHELYLADDPTAWSEAGFDVADNRCQIGTTTLRFVAGERAVVGWSFVDVAECDLDGIACFATDGVFGPNGDHANTSTLVDHVVVMTPDMSRTNEALAEIGLDLRRVRDVPGTDPARQQAFYRSGEVVIEVVGTAEASGEGPSSLWGLVTVVSDIEVAAEHLGDLLSEPKIAVQPGRRIATIRKEAGLGVPVALITPDPRYHR